jgi:hypothetical protein
VFITEVPIIKLFASGEEDMYERRRAEACVDESAHHALVNAVERQIGSSFFGVCKWNFPSRNQ